MFVVFRHWQIWCQSDLTCRRIVFRYPWLFMSSGPSQSTVIASSMTLYYFHMMSTMDMYCISHNNLLLYTSWYSGCLGVFLLDEIMYLPCCIPSIIRDAGPFFYLKYPSLTIIYITCWSTEDILRLCLTGVSGSTDIVFVGFTLYMMGGGCSCEFECSCVYFFLS